MKGLLFIFGLSFFTCLSFAEETSPSNVQPRDEIHTPAKNVEPFSPDEQPGIDANIDRLIKDVCEYDAQLADNPKYAPAKIRKANQLEAYKEIMGKDLKGYKCP